MRRKSLLTLILGLLLLAGISRVQAQVTVMNWDQQWRYLITNSLPTGWSASNYPAASGWPQGAGVLAFPLAETMPGGVPAPMTELATNFNTTFVTSFYFRTSITLASNPTMVAISGSAVIDDGAVIYVNGREALRVGMPAAPTVIGPNTLASRGGDVDDRAADTITLASSNFVQGVNVIAVEVHQDAGTSSDVVFGLRLTVTPVIPPSPPVITQQPRDVEVDVGQSAQFSVGASGVTPLTYRWYSNNVALPPSGTATHTTPGGGGVFNNTLADGSRYFVVITNRLGAVTSSVVVLRVLERGPMLTNAVPIASSRRVQGTFHESIAQGQETNTFLTNFNNYVILEFGTTNRVTFTNIQVGANSVILSLHSNEVLNPALDYVLCVSNMRDARGNATAQSCIGIGFAKTNPIVPFALTWDYTFGLGPPAANWTQLNYVLEDIWATDGQAPFFQDQVFSGTLCGSVNGASPTAISTTYYFRLPFTIPAGTDLTLPVRMQYMIDDGAVFYLNGTEFHRYSMPTGPITHTTLALGPTEANCSSALVTNLSNLLRIGNNVLAVEVHQVADQGGLENDIVFDTKLEFTFLDAPIIPKLVMTRPTPTTFRISWTTNVTGWVFESAPGISGPWTTNPSQVIGGVNVFQGPFGTQQTNRFFRVRHP